MSVGQLFSPVVTTYYQCSVQQLSDDWRWGC